MVPPNLGPPPLRAHAPGGFSYVDMKHIIGTIFILFHLVSYAQIPGFDYNVEIDRITNLDLSDFTGTGYGKNQEEATDNALRDLSIKLGVEVLTSFSYSYVNGEKAIANQTKVTAGLVVPRGMVETEICRPERKMYCVEVVLKVKEYILDCERRIAECEMYYHNAQDRNLYPLERWLSLSYYKMKYKRKILDTPIYWNFDRERTRLRVENIDSSIRYFEQEWFNPKSRAYIGPPIPGVIIDSSLEAVVLDL